MLKHHNTNGLPILYIADHDIQTNAAIGNCLV